MMDSLALCFVVLSAALGWAAWQAWRLRNERRDVWLIGATGGAAGVGAALVQWL